MNTRLEKPRVREVAEPETNQGAGLVRSLHAIKNLQGMRKLLAESDVALAMSVVTVTRNRLEDSRNLLNQKVHEVQSRRTDALKERMTDPASREQLLTWTSAESKWLDRVEQRKAELKENEEAARISEEKLASAIRRRKLIESRYLKYEEIINTSETDSI